MFALMIMSTGTNIIHIFIKITHVIRLTFRKREEDAFDEDTLSFQFNSDDMCSRVSVAHCINLLSFRGIARHNLYLRKMSKAKERWNQAASERSGIKYAPYAVCVYVCQLSN